MDVVGVVAISEIDFDLALSSSPLAFNAWQFVYDESDGRNRRTADPTRPSVCSGLLVRVGALGATLTFLSASFVFFLVESIDKRIV